MGSCRHRVSRRPFPVPRNQSYTSLLLCAFAREFRPPTSPATSAPIYRPRPPRNARCADNSDSARCRTLRPCRGILARRRCSTRTSPLERAGPSGSWASQANARPQRRNSGRAVIFFRTLLVCLFALLCSFFRLGSARAGVGGANHEVGDQTRKSRGVGNG
jgi:hypothetical protein